MEPAVAMNRCTRANAHIKSTHTLSAGLTSAGCTSTARCLAIFGCYRKLYACSPSMLQLETSPGLRLCWDSKSCTETSAHLFLARRGITSGQMRTERRVLGEPVPP